ncbi:hypothetical protein PJL18_04368 [Paenarthrobacter nicotinovorans]|nr:hypothetical protein [Paenarthrobacter nicotinovorans]
MSGCRSGAEHVGQDLLMQLLTPGNPGMLHFDGNDRASRFRCEQQLQPLPALVVSGQVGDRLLLGRELRLQFGQPSPRSRRGKVLEAVSHTQIRAHESLALLS